MKYVILQSFKQVLTACVEHTCVLAHLCVCHRWERVHVNCYWSWCCQPPHHRYSCVCVCVSIARAGFSLTGDLSFSHHCQFCFFGHHCHFYSLGCRPLFPACCYIGKNLPLLLWGPLFLCGPLFGRTCRTCLNLLLSIACWWWTLRSGPHVWFVTQGISCPPFMVTSWWWLMWDFFHSFDALPTIWQQLKKNKSSFIYYLFLCIVQVWQKIGCR